MHHFPPHLSSGPSTNTHLQTAHDTHGMSQSRGDYVRRDEADSESTRYCGRATYVKVGDAGPREIHLQGNTLSFLVWDETARQTACPGDGGRYYARFSVPSDTHDILTLAMDGTTFDTDAVLSLPVCVDGDGDGLGSISSGGRDCDDTSGAVSVDLDGDGGCDPQPVVTAPEPTVAITSAPTPPPVVTPSPTTTDPTSSPTLSPTPAPIPTPQPTASPTSPCEGFSTLPSWQIRKACGDMQPLTLTGIGFNPPITECSRFARFSNFQEMCEIEEINEKCPETCTGAKLSVGVQTECPAANMEFYERGPFGAATIGAMEEYDSCGSFAAAGLCADTSGAHSVMQRACSQTCGIPPSLAAQDLAEGHLSPSLRKYVCGDWDNILVPGHTCTSLKDGGFCGHEFPGRAPVRERCRMTCGEPALVASDCTPHDTSVHNTATCAILASNGDCANSFVARACPAS